MLRSDTRVFTGLQPSKLAAVASVLTFMVFRGLHVLIKEYWVCTVLCSINQQQPTLEVIPCSHVDVRQWLVAVVSVLSYHHLRWYGYRFYFSTVSFGYTRFRRKRVVILN